MTKGEEGAAQKRASVSTAAPAPPRSLRQARLRTSVPPLRAHGPGSWHNLGRVLGWVCRHPGPGAHGSGWVCSGWPPGPSDLPPVGPTLEACPLARPAWAAQGGVHSPGPTALPHWTQRAPGVEATPPSPLQTTRGGDRALAKCQVRGPAPCRPSKAEPSPQPPASVPCHRRELCQGHQQDSSKCIYVHFQFPVVSG